MKKLILAGAGHGHVNILRKMISDSNFNKYFEGLQITLITDCRYQYYSGMIPGFIAGDYSWEEICFDVKKLSEEIDINYVEEKITEIDSESKVVITDGGSYEFDYISMNLGSETREVITSADIDSVVNVKPISNIVTLKENLDKGNYKKIVIIGSGASSIELALSIGFKYEDVKISIISSSEYILKAFNEKTRKKVMDVLGCRNIDVYLSSNIGEVLDEFVEFNGNRLEFDCCIMATGVKGQGVVYKGYETTNDNFLVVDSTLFANDFSIATGDMISIKEYPKLEKAGVIAIRQSPVLINNFLKMIGKESEVKKFEPRSSYLQILNLGGKKAIINFGKFTNKGKISWLIKDYIDRGYMNIK